MCTSRSPSWQLGWLSSSARARVRSPGLSGDRDPASNAVCHPTTFDGAAREGLPVGFVSCHQALFSTKHNSMGMPLKFPGRGFATSRQELKCALEMLMRGKVLNSLPVAGLAFPDEC